LLISVAFAYCYKLPHKLPDLVVKERARATFGPGRQTSIPAQPRPLPGPKSSTLLSDIPTCEAGIRRAQYIAFDGAVNR